MMDAISLLKDDHDAVEALLTELAESTSRAVKKRAELLEKIRVELKAHATIEEEIFYPAFKAKGDRMRGSIPTSSRNTASTCARPSPAR